MAILDVFVTRGLIHHVALINFVRGVDYLLDFQLL